MPFERWGYTFRGPYPSGDSLQELAGVYVIWCKNEETWTVLDVGEADNIKEEVKDHKHADCWLRNCSGTIYYSAVYTPDQEQTERMRIIKKISGLTNILCSEGQ